MRIFVTGGTGFIGSALVQELSGSGHEVAALHRRAESAARLKRLGASPVLGDLHDPEEWEPAASGHDVLIHCAFDYKKDGVKADAGAADALLRAAATEGGGRLVVYTSGCWVLGETGEEPADESAPTDDPAEVVAWRPDHERRVLEAGEDGVPTAVIRPGVVYGGHGGLTRKLFESAEEEGTAAYVGDGGNHWSMIHRRDLARLYRMVAEAGGRGIFHGVDGRPVRLAQVARAASDAAGAGGAVRSIPLEQARESLGKVADALCLDQRLVGRRSLEIGWRPEHSFFPDAAERAYRELKAWRH